MMAVLIISYVQTYMDYLPDGSPVVVSQISSTGATDNERSKSEYGIMVSTWGYDYYPSSFTLMLSTWWDRLLIPTTTGFATTGQWSISGNPECFLLRVDIDGNPINFIAYGTWNTEYCYALWQTSDGGYALIGYTQQTNYDILLIKTDASGTLQWAKRYDYGGNEYGYGVVQTSDGGYIITAYGGSGGIIIKTDASGNVQWARNVNIYLYNGMPVSRGGYIFTGSYGSDVALLRVNNLGSWVWVRAYGGPSSEAGLSVREIPDSGYIIAGHTDSWGAGSIDDYVIRTDTSGNLIWNRVIGVGGSTEATYSVSLTPDGFFLSGALWSITPPTKIAKLSRSGSVLYYKYPSGGQPFGGSTAIGSDGSYAAAIGWYIAKMTSNLGMNPGCLSDAPITVVNPSPNIYSPSIIFQDITPTLNAYPITLNTTTSPATRYTWCSPLSRDTSLSVVEYTCDESSIKVLKGGAIYYEGEFEVYDVYGKRIGVSKDNIFTPQKKGIFFVKTNNKVFKVVKF